MTDRDLDATDHLNKKMLEMYKHHLDHKTVKVPNNGKIGAKRDAEPKKATDKTHRRAPAAESDDWDDADDLAKLCTPISEDADPASVLVAAPDAADAADAADTTAQR